MTHIFRQVSLNFVWTYITLLFAATAFTMIGCGGSVSTENLDSPSDKIIVTATTSIVADWAQQIGGERVFVDSVIPYGSDGHSYQVTADGVKKIAESDYIFGIGLGYEDKWLTKLLDNYPEGRVLYLGSSVDPIPFHDEHDEEDEHGHGQFDPHIWFDPIRVAEIATVLGEELERIDPKGAQYYQDRVRDYIAELNDLHSNISKKIAEIPIESRVIITSHESLGYLEARYGIEVLTAVIPGLDAEVLPTPKDLIFAIKQINDKDIKVIFVDETRSAKASERVSEETGIRVVTGLKVESLTVGQTYLDFMENNMNIIFSNIGP